jgi:hypothetical protein
MAAGLGFKTFAVGEVLSAANVNGYLMQGVLVFANAAARDAAITSPQEGQFAFTKDNDSLWYYSGSAWVASGATGDIEGVTAGTGISGGGTSGTVTITNSMATEITAKGDLVVGTGNATFDNLPVGTNGHVLTADSTVSPTGLKWAAVASTSFPTFSAYDASTQSINANVYTKITFGTESWDTGSAFASSRFTPQTAGYYIVSGMVGAATGTAEDVYWQVYKNGASWQMGSLIKTTGNNYGSGNILVYLNGSTDYIEIYASSSNNVTIGGGAEKRYFAAIGIRS